MGDGHVWVLASSTVMLIDVSSYGIKEWLQLIAAAIAIFVSIIGAWRTYRYSKSQITKRLSEYLSDEEKVIKDARNRVLRHIRYGEPLTDKANHLFYHDLKSALSYLNRGEATRAEEELNKLVVTLTKDADLGQKYIANADLQMGTVLLLKGKIADVRSESAAARTAREAAVRCYSQDAEAQRYLGELALAGGEVKTAVRHFSQAYSLAPDDMLLRAETWEAVAGYYQQQGRPMLELGALAACAPNFTGAEAHGRAATIYSRAGELATLLNRNRQAPKLLRGAFENYRLSGDRDGMRATRERLDKLGVDVSDLPSVDQARRRRIPWEWIRLALELSILAAAAYLFFLTLR